MDLKIEKNSCFLMIRLNSWTHLIGKSQDRLNRKGISKYLAMLIPLIFVGLNVTTSGNQTIKN